MSEFSYKTRQKNLERFRTETFDLLIIGGGITGAATAREAASRGLKVAVVEKKDFAWGTSSRSSKLIHGGLRYLENMEWGLVFEALSERAQLLKLVPHMVRPLRFLMPVYRGNKPGRVLLTVGLWLYDLLSLFRTPGFHRHLSRKKLLGEVPFLKEEGLLGGFSYYDASMWDDVLAIEILRAAHTLGAAIANYVEALTPLWEEDRIVGFRVRDMESRGREEIIDLKAVRVVVCAGPWTDQVGITLSPQWRRWLNPSKGVHLVFDWRRLPVPGALVMSHPEDGRISFVVPRQDYGSGVVIVGTTDSVTPSDPEKAAVDPSDVKYLMDLLNRYFPSLGLTSSDIISAYVGVRPLMGMQAGTAGSEGQNSAAATAAELQKVSREHYIGSGPGGTVLVAGGKYTTHRTMAREIVDFTLEAWRQGGAKGGLMEPPPSGLGPSATDSPVNPRATLESVKQGRREAAGKGWQIPEELWGRYGAEALEIMEVHEMALERPGNHAQEDPEGFPLLAAQLRHAIRTEMVLRLEDFYLRRAPLYATRADHGLPWAEELARIWAAESGLPESAASVELQRLKEEFDCRSAWKSLFATSSPDVR